MGEDNKYEKLDAMLLEVVGLGKNRFSDILANVRPLATELVEKKTEADRLVDRRLQALRRGERLVFNKGGGTGAGWQLPQAK